MVGRARTFIFVAMWMVWVSCAKPKGASDAGGSSVPNRIVSQTVVSDELLWRMGATVRARVVGVSRMADDRRYSSVANTWASDMPRVPASGEAILARAPDLVIVASFTSEDTIKLIRDAGVRVVVMDQFSGFADYGRTIERLAQAVAAPEAGRHLWSEFVSRRDAIVAHTPKGPKPTVVSWNEGAVPGRGTTFDDVAAAAGFENLAARRGIDGNQRVATELLLEWDPQYIVTNCPEDACQTHLERFAKMPGIEATSAARSAKLIGVPSRILYSTGEDMLSLAERMQQGRR